LATSAQQVLDPLFEQPIANINTLVKGSSLTPATFEKVMDRLSQAWHW
jgi:hypothetical protein